MPSGSPPSWGVLFWSCGPCLSDMGRFEFFMGRFGFGHGAFCRLTGRGSVPAARDSPPYGQRGRCPSRVAKSYAKLCEMGLCASCREAPTVVLRFSCQRSNWLIPLPLSKCASTPSKRAELVMGERCCTGRPEGGTAFRRLRPPIALAIASRPYTGR